MCGVRRQHLHNTYCRVMDQLQHSEIWRIHFSHLRLPVLLFVQQEARSTICGISFNRTSMVVDLTRRFSVCWSIKFLSWRMMVLISNTPWNHSLSQLSHRSCDAQQSLSTARSCLLTPLHPVMSQTTLLALAIFPQAPFLVHSLYNCHP